jgi:Ser/Thr protein kinase RdoA (MazF antagonist)
MNRPKKPASPLSESFYNLTPDVVLKGVEAAGFIPTGEYQQLNSYENRVFDIHLEPEGRVIAKYYRPGRWRREAILEEHFFLEELKTLGIPAVAPLAQNNRDTLSSYEGMWLAVFPRAVGRMPQELALEDLVRVGRLLAQIHNVGEQNEARHRPILDVESYGAPALRFLKDWVAPEVWERYENAALNILDFLDEHLDEDEFHRIHGDCHRGNLLQQDSKDGERGFFVVDFDDFVTGPAAQDFWMLLSGEEDLRDEELSALMSGYEELRHFPREQRRLFEPLRGLRILHYAAWIARRWEDPSFPQLFPQFGEYSYWAEETEALEKISWSL